MIIDKKNVVKKVYLILLVFAACCALFYRFVFNGSILIGTSVLSDLTRANLPVYIGLYDDLREGFSLWSWKMGIGTSWATHFDVMFDPFTYIVFIAGRNSIATMFVWVMIAKIILSGLFFSFYLDEFNVSYPSNFVSSFLYAFNGYLLIMGSNFALGTIMVYLPIVLLVIEKYVNKHAHPIALFILFFLCSAYSYYYTYQLIIVIFFYIVFRMMILGYCNRQSILTVLCPILFIEFLGVCAAAVVLLPQIQLVMSSGRMSSPDVEMTHAMFIPQLKAVITIIARMLFNNSLGTNYYSNYVGYMDYFSFASNGACIIPVLALQYLLNISDSKKKHIITLIIVFCVIVITIPFFSLFMNAFGTINYRWYFIINSLIMMLASFGIDSIVKNGGLYRRTFAFSVLCIYAFIFIIEFFLISTSRITSTEALYENSTRRVLKLVLMFTVIWVLILSADLITQYIKRKGSKKIISIIGRIGSFCVICLLFVDTLINYYYYYNIDEQLWDISKNGMVYLADDYSVIQSIRSEDDSFYRIEKSFSAFESTEGIDSDNDALAQNYYGTSSYNSLNNNNYLRFVQSMGVFTTVPIESIVDDYASKGTDPQSLTGQELNYINGFGKSTDYYRFAILNYLGVKYYIANDKNIAVPEYFDIVRKEHGFVIYKNNAAYPLAFHKTKAISESDFMELDDSLKDYVLLNYAILDDQDLEYCYTRIMEFPVNYIPVISDIPGYNSSTVIKSFRQDHFTCDINCFQDGVITITIPYDKNWNVIMDGEPIDPIMVDLGMIGIPAQNGTHYIECYYDSSIIKYGAYISMVAILTMGVVVLLRRRLEKRYFSKPIDLLM